MKRGAERFARGEFDRKLPVPSFSELGALAQAMNRMAEQLDDRFRLIVSQRNEHEALLASMAEGVLAVDREERVLSLNAAGETLLGVRAADSQGRSIQEAVRNVELQRLVCADAPGRGSR
jgi:two-component system, OmpR family, phosphate regulon sensor histidine kinase PhoR